MAIAVVLVIMVVASVLFHFLSPWWLTPLASNWKQMDDTLTITLVITGLFFVVINLLLGYIVWRFRHREGHRAAYEPENRRLEHWLIGLSAVGIMALLAPGLIDLRAKSGEPGNEPKETLKSLVRAAAAGGVTSVVVQPDTDPAIDDPAMLTVTAIQRLSGVKDRI